VWQNDTAQGIQTTFDSVDEHGEGLIQRKPTNAQIPLELQ